MFNCTYIICIGSDCQKGDWQSHKRACKRQNFLLRVQLAPHEILNPPISRTLSCPAGATFLEFHKALQIAFGWASTHCYDFKVKDPVAEAEADAAERTEDMASCIARMTRTMSPGDDGSSNRRYILRIVDEQPRGPGGFYSGIGVDAMYDRQRKHAQTPQSMSHKVRLHNVFERDQYQNLLFEYEYDFGDRWCHDIKLLGRRDATDFFMCTDGEGHGCAEDVGSVDGWQNLKKAHRATNPTDEQREKMHWYETMASNSDSQGLGGGRDRVWAKGMINRKLGEFSGQAISFS